MPVGVGLSLALCNILEAFPEIITKGDIQRGLLSRKPMKFSILQFYNFHGPRILHMKQG